MGTDRMFEERDRIERQGEQWNTVGGSVEDLIAALAEAGLAGMTAIQAIKKYVMAYDKLRKLVGEP